ncbi:hypothetical protein DMENIID0001_043730 [Sergentomyia squamirostris]
MITFLKMSVARKEYDEKIAKGIRRQLPLSSLKNFKELDEKLLNEKWQDAFALIVTTKKKLNDIISDEIVCEFTMSGRGNKKLDEKLINLTSSKVYKIWKDSQNTSEFEDNITKELKSAKMRVYSKRHAAKKKAEGRDCGEGTSSGEVNLGTAQGNDSDHDMGEIGSQT